MKNKSQKTRYEMVWVRRHEIITQFSQPAHAESLFQFDSSSSLFTRSDFLPYSLNLIDKTWGLYFGNLFLRFSNMEKEKVRLLKTGGGDLLDRGLFGWCSGSIFRLGPWLYRLVYASQSRPGYALM
jgi:hypothetical protein